MCSAHHHWALRELTVEHSLLELYTCNRTPGCIPVTLMSLLSVPFLTLSLCLAAPCSWVSEGPRVNEPPHASIHGKRAPSSPGSRGAADTVVSTALSHTESHQGGRPVPAEHRAMKENKPENRVEGRRARDTQGKTLVRLLSRRLHTESNVNLQCASTASRAHSKYKGPETETDSFRTMRPVAAAQASRLDCQDAKAALQEGSCQTLQVSGRP